MDVLRELQICESKILNEFRLVCEKHNLTYFLSYGTLLGAVRHQGFIPWDDDIDVSMPRKDYEKFCSTLYKDLPEGLEFCHYKIDKGYLNYAPRIIDKSITIVDGNNQQSYAWIDIFPIDGMPPFESNQYKKHKKRLLSTRNKLNIARLGCGIKFNNNLKSKKERFIINILTLFKVGRIFSLDKQLNRLNDLLCSHDLDDNDRICINFMGEKFKDECPSSYYYPPKKLLFEGEYYDVPGEYQNLLEKLYGNYMELPPIEKRNVHNYKEIIVNR